MAPDGLADLVSGFAAGATCTAVGQPLDTAKVRMQASGGTLSATLRSLARESPAALLFRGLWTPLLTLGALNSASFAAYGLAAAKLAPGVAGDGRSGLTARQAAAAGAVSGFTFSLGACPVELVKSLQQNELGRARASALQVVRRLVAESGPAGIYRGYGACLVRDLPFGAIYFVTYEQAKSFAHRSLPAATRPPRPEDSAACVLAAGAAAGVVPWLLCFPLDGVKTRVQLGQGSVVEVARAAARSGTAYRGLSAALLRAGPATAASLYMYETVNGYVRGAVRR